MSRRESPFHLDIAGATHIGGRRANVDHYRYDADLGLLAVASGVPSQPAGRVAAEAAIEALFDYVTDPNMTSPADARERIDRAFAHVDRRVREQAAADDQLRGMATTLACAMERGRLLLIGHVGDSRVTRLREGRLERLTVDHRRGSDPLVLTRIVPGAAGGDETPALTRAIGFGARVAPDGRLETLRANDGVLVATAGLTAVLDEQTILAVVKRAGQPRNIVNELIQRALSRGAPENITCVYGHWRPIGL